MGLRIDKVKLQGINLVEASAGTGKTHTLTSLYLRLLLESGLAPESILVMTYTQAATAELKGRIRQRLLEAREKLDGVSPASSGESESNDIDDSMAARKRLDLAIAGFDQAAVYTIHGFCQRVLTEQAFETGQSFQVELVPDQAERLQQIADDFWRRELDQLPPVFLQAFRLQIPTPEVLLARLRVAQGKPYLHVRARPWPEGLAELEAASCRQRDALRSLWQAEAAVIQSLLSDKRVMNGRRYRADWVTGWCRQMTQWLEMTPYAEPFDKVERFTPDFIAQSVKGGQATPSHAFFQGLAAYLIQVERCGEAFRQAFVALQARFYDYQQAELPQRQAEAGEWSYDDLLLQLQQALRGDSGERLAALLRRRYPAALVDEFQDTDPVQYEILQRIYQKSNLPVFLVGDPKQAIYSFRGADIFAYLKARQAAGAAVHTLENNWRSASGLIQAVNRLFQAAARPFFYPQIEFHPVTPARREVAPLSVRGDASAPLRIWQLPFDRHTPLEAVRGAVAEATAEEISRLLGLAARGAALIGSQPLRGGDFAVLVRTHQQGERIARALRQRGIHAVRSSQQSVYWSEEAEALERLLMALLEPQRGGLLRAALATPLLGWDGARIDSLTGDDAAMGEIATRFFDFHRIWRGHGFIVMFRRLMMAEQVENRLLDDQDGERRLTNLTHLAELLHQQDSAARPGMEGLVKWFGRQRQSASRDEERLQRLESDSHLVKIDTLHGSKGLEYPIVFCPFLWDESPDRSDDRPYLFHDPREDYSPVLEIGSKRFAEDYRRQQEEALAESLRLLYVALTRASLRCYLPWGAVKQSEYSALAWLLHGGRETAQEISLDEWRKTARELANEEVDRVVTGLAASAKGNIALMPLPVENFSGQMPLSMPPELVQARRFRGEISVARQIVSFSSLAVGHMEDLPDYDALIGTRAKLQALPERFDIHGFPRGPGPGSCLHAVLERIDFSAAKENTLSETIGEQLRLHAIDERWIPVVAELVVNLIGTPLNGEGLSLDQVKRPQRIDEMAFHFPVHHLDPRTIHRLAKGHHFSDFPLLIEGLGNLEAHRVDGFMTGYIDLIFEWRGRYYLADYKSNWLGDGIDDYHPSALQAAMKEHHYPLQYALYTLALHRYLKLRLPGYEYEQHFGGVFYLFLRGIQPKRGTESGILAERPSLDFVQSLDLLMEDASRVGL